FGGDRLHVGRVGQIRVGHDRRRVGVDQDDPVALFLQRLAGLGAGIVELTGLADDDRARPDDEDGLDVGTLGHLLTLVGARGKTRGGAAVWAGFAGLGARCSGGRREREASVWLPVSAPGHEKPPRLPEAAWWKTFGRSRTQLLENGIEPLLPSPV